MFILEPYVHLCSVIDIHVPCTSCCHCCSDAVFAVLQSAKKRKKKSAGGEETENGTAAAAEPVQPSQTLTAESYTPPDPGPYPQDKPPENPVRFTPVQVNAFIYRYICLSLLASSCNLCLCTDLLSYTPMHLPNLQPADSLTQPLTPHPSSTPAPTPSPSQPAHSKASLPVCSLHFMHKLSSHITWPPLLTANTAPPQSAEFHS